MAADNLAIQPKGGNKILLIELTSFSGGTLTIPTLTANTNCIDLGHLNQSGFSSNPTDEVIKNDMLQNAYTTTDFDEVTEGILMERIKLKQDFLRYYVPDKFFLQLHNQGYVKSKWQEELAIGQVIPNRNNTFPQGATSWTYKFRKIAMEVDTVISAANITTIEAALGSLIYMTGPATIAAGRYDVLTET